MRVGVYSFQHSLFKYNVTHSVRLGYPNVPWNSSLTPEMCRTSARSQVLDYTATVLVCIEVYILKLPDMRLA